jgi:hypothetical protein
MVPSWITSVGAGVSPVRPRQSSRLRTRKARITTRIPNALAPSRGQQNTVSPTPSPQVCRKIPAPVEIGHSSPLPLTLRLHSDGGVAASERPVRRRASTKTKPLSKDEDSGRKLCRAASRCCQSLRLMPELSSRAVLSAQAIRGVLCAMPRRPRASSKIMPPCPFTRAFK